jgi:hypothetical protein
MCRKFEQEKQKSQEQIQQSVSQFILRCQEGGSAVENIANCHKQLLGIEVQRQIEGKFHDFEKKLRDFLGSELAQLESRGNDVQNKLFARGGLVEQVGICLHSVEGIKSDFQKEILAIRQANRELCSGVDRKFAEIAAGLKMVGEESKSSFGTLAQEIQQRFEATRNESKALGGRVAAIEKFLGSQEVPWDKVVEMLGKSEATIQLEVRREMAAQVRKMMEIMMVQMMDEKLRQTQKEKHFKKLQTDIENRVKQQFFTVLMNMQTDFQREKSQREGLQKLCQTLQTRLDFMEGRVQEISAEKTQQIDPKAPEVAQPKTVNQPNSGIFGIKGVSPAQSSGIFGINGVTPMMPCEIWDVDLGGCGPSSSSQGGAIAINQVSGICAIGGAPQRPPVISVGNPAVQHVLRNLTAPKFSGKSQDWHQFSEDWQALSRKLNSAGGEVSEDLKVALLEDCLDETSK